MSKKLLMQGNEAAVEGAIAAGMRFFAGYPITPSTEIAETCALRLPQEGGKFIQMEDELASIAAVLGASAAGMKAMTATSGPGFSLMQENIGYGAMAEIPCVIVDRDGGDPLRDRGRAALRSLDRPADQPLAGRLHAGEVGHARRPSGHRALPGLGAGDLYADHPRLQPGGEIPHARDLPHGRDRGPHARGRRAARSAHADHQPAENELPRRREQAVLLRARGAVRPRDEALRPGRALQHHRSCARRVRLPGQLQRDRRQAHRPSAGQGGKERRRHLPRRGARHGRRRDGDRLLRRHDPRRPRRAERGEGRGQKGRHVPSDHGLALPGKAA